MLFSRDLLMTPLEQLTEFAFPPWNHVRRRYTFLSPVLTLEIGARQDAVVWLWQAHYTAGVTFPFHFLLSLWVNCQLAPRRAHLIYAFNISLTCQTFSHTTVTMLLVLKGPILGPKAATFPWCAQESKFHSYIEEEVPSQQLRTGWRWSLKGKLDGSFILTGISIIVSVTVPLSVNTRHLLCIRRCVDGLLSLFSILTWPCKLDIIILLDRRRNKGLGV